MVIVNVASMNTGIRASFQVRVFSTYTPRSGIADHMVVLVLLFQITFILFSMVAVPIHIPMTVQERSLYSTPSPAFIICRL